MHEPVRYVSRSFKEFYKVVLELLNLIFLIFPSKIEVLTRWCCRLDGELR
jgi:hypothetical protein